MLRLTLGASANQEQESRPSADSEPIDFLRRFDFVLGPDEAQDSADESLFIGPPAELQPTLRSVGDVPQKADDGYDSRLAFGESMDDRQKRLAPQSPNLALSQEAAASPLCSDHDAKSRPLKPTDHTPGRYVAAGGIEFRLIPAGEFEMGSADSDREADADEKPQHPVRITRPFYLGAYEVTQGQYRAVTGKSPSRFQRSDDLPVEQVSWNDAIMFCNSLSEQEGLKPYYRSGTSELSGGDGYRLPTEAEWEYACRAGARRDSASALTPGKLDEHAWYGGNSENQTHPVGQMRPNAFGLYDMIGNVFEWCQDLYDAEYYEDSPPVDPDGPSARSGGGRFFDRPRCTLFAAVAGTPPARSVVRRSAAQQGAELGATSWGSAWPELRLRDQ